LRTKEHTLMAQIPVGVQLYTVRDETAKDFIGTLKRVAAIGYAGVEFAGFGNLPATEIKAALDDLGLRAAGSHVGIELLRGDLPAVIDYHVTIGCPRVIIPWLPEQWRPGGAGWTQLCAEIPVMGRACKAAGLEFCYHNHDFEFDLVDGVPALDRLFAETDAALLKAELDLYWVTYAGRSPVEYITKYAGRLPNVHIKDMVLEPERTYAEVGEGIIDWQPIFAAAKAAGVQWYVVEHDSPTKYASLESIAISFASFQQWGLA
jgi:sugar phosphate isomerase/epimerase